MAGTIPQPLSDWLYDGIARCHYRFGRRTRCLRTAALRGGLSNATVLIGAPDLRLPPHRYRARTLPFRAGLELPLLHHGLGALACLVRLGLRRYFERLTRLLRWAR